ncbi:MAG: YeeE/YedE family protein [Planctomycetales bacterium]|nr:YeeE/YedE family protein [Planctomycetales bacterium]
MHAVFDIWHWSISGILIGLTVPMLFWCAGKSFGISTSLQQLGAMCSPNSRLDYLRKFDQRENFWTVVFVAGIAAGAGLANQFLTSESVEFLPNSFYSWVGATKLLIGGFLIGFGTRYAGGCTSGHSITGIAHANWASLWATICFFIGGLAVTWFILFEP